MDISRIYYDACQFEETAGFLSHQISLPLARPPVIAFVVNATFSIELFLKCLIVIETRKKPKRIHDLHELYRMLSRESQTAVNDEFLKIVALSPLLNIPDFPSDNLQGGVESVLKGMDDAFVKWRYSSMGMTKSYNVSFTKEIITSIKVRINSIYSIQ